MRLLGEPFQKCLDRTQGIKIQAVKIKEDDWKREIIKSENVEKNFNAGVLIKKKELEDKSVTSTRPTEELEEINEGDTTDTEEDTGELAKQAEIEHRKEESKEVSPKVDKSTNMREEIIYQRKVQSNKEHRKEQKVDKSSLLGYLESGKESIDDEEDYIVFGWDFGGHTEYYATHQLFMVGEAVHLIVMDITKPFTSPVEQDDKDSANIIKCYPTTPAQFLCYWLKSIHNEYKEKGVTPTIAIFLTHIDEINETDETKRRKIIETYKIKILTEISGKPYDELIFWDNIYEVDNTSQDKGHFQRARQDILQMITKQHSWGQKRPLQWLKLEADILREQENEPVKYLEISKIQEELATNHGMTKEDVEHFLTFHHEMGEFIHFNDKSLNDKVVIDAQWLVDKLKVLIAPDKFLEENMQKELKQGWISERNLNQIWGEGNTPFLKQLMEKFNILVPCPKASSRESESDKSEDDGSFYFVSSILPNVNPDEYAQQKFKGCRKIYTATYRSRDFIPIGIYHTLISNIGEAKIGETKVMERASIPRTENTAVYFEENRSFILAIILLSYVETMAIETSIWFNHGDIRNPIQKGITDDTSEIRKMLQKVMKGFGMEDTDGFKLLCPNCIELGDDKSEHFVTLTESKDPKTSDPIFKTCDAKCVRKGVFWDSRTYQGTVFGE